MIRNDFYIRANGLSISTKGQPRRIRASIPPSCTGRWAKVSFRPAMRIPYCCRCSQDSVPASAGAAIWRYHPWRICGR